MQYRRPVSALESLQQGGREDFTPLACGRSRRPRHLPSTPSRLLMNHCCVIDRMLFVSQYSTRPAGKTKNITENTSGMIHIIFACIGSGGVGDSQVCSNEEPVIRSGRM